MARDPQASPRKFSLTWRMPRSKAATDDSGSPAGTDEEVTYYLIEARDREEAEQILREELGSKKLKSGTATYSTHNTEEWRTAWRQGDVEVLKPTKLPEGIE